MIKVSFISLCFLLVAELLMGQSKSGIYLVTPAVSDSKSYELFYRDSIYYYKLNDTALISFSLIDTVFKSKNYQKGTFQLNIRFNKSGQKIFAKVTERYIENQIGIVINNKLVSAPWILSPITGGSITIENNFTEEWVDEAITELIKVIAKKQ